MRESLIWLATVRERQLDAWTLIKDSPANRTSHGLPVSVERIVDHVDLQVRDLRISRAFYEALLAPLDYRVVLEDVASGSVALGTPGYDDFGLKQSSTPTQRAHVAFAAASAEQVDRFYARALELGVRGHGAPGYRPHYGAGYYAAFVYDPDGNNIEAVHREQQR